MRKLFVSAIALLFISQIAMSAETASDTETPVTEEKAKNVNLEDKEKAVETEDTQKSEEAEKGTKEVKPKNPSEEQGLKESSEEESTVTQSKNSENAVLPTIESRDFLQDVNGVLSCINPDLIAAQPIETEDGWVIFIEVREDVVQALSSRDLSTLFKLLIKSENVNQTLVQMVQNMLISTVTDMNDETIEILEKLNLIKNETFRSWLKKNDLETRYSSKIDEKTEKNQSFIAIPLVYSKTDNKLIIDFSKVKHNINSLLVIASKIQESEKIIKEQLEKRNEKITPEMQKSLDEFKALEDENKVLTKKVEDEKARVSADIEASQKAKTHAEKKKADTEKKLKITENTLKTEQSNLTKNQNDLKQIQSQKNSKQTRLNNLNNRKTRNAELKKMKTETKNKRLNINTAKSQTQSQLNTLKSKESILNKNITANQTKIKNLQNESTKLNKEKTEIENTIKESSEKITSLQGGIDSIETLKNNNENQIKELKSREDVTRALVYAGDSDKEIDNQVENSNKSFNQLLTA